MHILLFFRSVVVFYSLISVILIQRKSEVSHHPYPPVAREPAFGKTPSLVQTGRAITPYFRFLFEVREFMGNEQRKGLTDSGGLF